MLGWTGLLVFLILGGWILLRPSRFSFRGSTLLGFLLLTLGMTSPQVFHPTRMMLASGAGSDAFIGVWDLWWARTALLHGSNPFHTGWLFHPNGTSLALHTFAFAYGLASLPLQGIGTLLAGTPGGLFAAYNLLLLLSFTLSGYLVYRLALEETGEHAAALLAGVVFAFSNFRFSNTVRLHVLCTEILVLATWAWVVWLRRPSAVRFAWLCAAVVLLVFGSLEYTAYAVLLFLVLGAPRAIALLREKRRTPAISPRAWSIVGASLAGALLLLLPLLVELLRRLGQGNTQFDPRLTTFFSADLLDPLLPNPRHPLWGKTFAAVTGGFHQGDAGFGLALGWVPLLLFGLTAAALHHKRSGRVWFWGALGFGLLSLGPALHLAGHVYSGFPLPQAWLAKALPFLAGSRTPIRYIAPGGICLSLALAHGVAARWGRGPARDLSRPETAVLALLLLESLSAPWALAEVPVPSVYRQIHAPAGSSALLHLPGMPARENLLYQTIHGQRLVENVESAVPLRSQTGPDPFARSEWAAWTLGLSRPGWLAQMAPPQREQAIGVLRGMLTQYQIRYVLLARAGESLGRDGRTYSLRPLVNDATQAAYLENLRLLGPAREQETPEETLFEFSVPPIAR